MLHQESRPEPVLQYAMRAVDFIEAKRDKKKHETRQITEFVASYCSGEIPDYQVSAWLMAVCINGLEDEETFALTQAMVDSGVTLDLSSVDGFKIDKHSTGGVGDKVTLAVVPLLAAAGIPVAKMSGRGLGYTGGTIDKVESIPGFRVSLSIPEILDTVSRVGACICSQTLDLAPADRMLYALRDVTGTVESIPLVASSIMSKKIAGGSDAILLDVKVGRGAFMKTLEQARELASLLVRIGNAHGKIVRASLTSMDMPLGRCVGNWLEVQEVAQLLQGRPCDYRLREEVIHFTTKGMEMAAKGSRPDVERLIDSGDGWNKFQAMIEAQGGRLDIFKNPPTSQITIDVLVDRSGYVTDIDALAIGRAAMCLGAGRERKDDVIDHLAGIEIMAPFGSRVDAGDPIARLHSSSAEQADEASPGIRSGFVISAQEAPVRPLILGEMSGQ